VIASQQRVFRTYLQAKEFARSLNLKSLKEWQAFARSGKRPTDIPANPSLVYKNKGWESWGNWLGNGNERTHNRNYRPFTEAREWARQLKLKNGKEWVNYCKTKYKPLDIPATPFVYYKEKGWISMGDWLGTGNPAPGTRKFRSFINSRSFVHKQKIGNRQEWEKFASSGSKPPDIPSTPHRIYKNEGWKGWKDWLGN